MPVFTPKNPYREKISPYSRHTVEPGFLLVEEGGFLLQEDEGRIILAGDIFNRLNPYSPKASPYTARA